MNAAGYLAGGDVVRLASAEADSDVWNRRNRRVGWRLAAMGAAVFVALVAIVYFWTSPPPDIVVYLNPRATPEEVGRVWHTVLSRPHPAGRGFLPLEGIASLSGLDASGRPGIRVRFHARVSDSRREAIKTSVALSPLVEEIIDLQE